MGKKITLYVASTETCNSELSNGGDYKEKTPVTKVDINLVQQYITDEKGNEIKKQAGTCSLFVTQDYYVSLKVELAIDTSKNGDKEIKMKFEQIQQIKEGDQKNNVALVTIVMKGVTVHEIKIDDISTNQVLFQLTTHKKNLALIWLQRMT